MIITLTMNPAKDISFVINQFTPGKSFLLHDGNPTPGGKGINVSRMLREWGEKSLTVAPLAGKNGDWIALELQKCGIVTNFTFLSGETRTNYKIVDPESHLTTELNTESYYDCPGDLNIAGRRLLDCLKQGDLLAICGSLPSALSPDYYAKLISRCHQIGVDVILDTSGDALRPALDNIPYGWKPNLEELQSVTSFPIRNRDDAAHAAWPFLLKGIRWILISMGSEGAVLATKEKVYYANAPEIEAGNLSGCGDAMVAAMLLGHSHHYSYPDSLALAVASASAKAMETGVTVPSISRIQNLLSLIQVEEF